MEAPTIPNIEIRKAFFKFMVLFFRLNKILAIAAGMKKSKLVACAMCCSNPMNSVNNKIKTEPPPKTKTSTDSCNYSD